MNDKFYLECLLTEIKNLCNILFYATTESSNPEVHQKMQTGLNVCLEWQNAIYKHMEAKGFYNVHNVDQSVINQEKTSIKPLDLQNCSCYCQN
jgi:spore coat protein CotF